MKQSPEGHPMINHQPSTPQATVAEQLPALLTDRAQLVVGNITGRDSGYST